MAAWIRLFNGRLTRAAPVFKFSPGCTSFQIFTKSNRQWYVKPLPEAEIIRYHQWQAETGIQPVVCHASYLLNLASAEDALWHKSVDALVIELERCEQLKIPHLVLHPGAHIKSGVEAGVAQVIKR